VGSDLHPEFHPLRVVCLALITALLAPAAAAAQDTNQKMLETAARIRATAEQMKGKLPPDQIASLIKQAEEMEQGVKDGAYGVASAPLPKEKPLSERLMAEHGRLDWIATKAACAGYTQENYSTFRFSPGINDRDSHCRNAYGHFARYLQAVRLGEGAEESEKALYYYDAAAKRALALVGR
jgi:hypothetical protein